MIEQLSLNEILVIAGAIGTGLAALFQYRKGRDDHVKERIKESEGTHIIIHEMLKKLQEIHEDVIKIRSDTVSIDEIDEKIIDILRSISVTMETENRTFDKVDQIFTAVSLLQELERRRNLGR